MHPPEPCLVHPLAPAPHFVGRHRELETLRSYWQAGFQGALALVGLGGSGKTALAASFLEELAHGQTPPRPHGLFVWSFYLDPDPGRFLQEAYRYFAPGDPSLTPAKGTGLLHLLGECLAAAGPHLLVLDGLERVQRQESSSAGDFGHIEDPLLKTLLRRCAEGIGQTMVLVTSRFPLTDLDAYKDQGYRHLDLGGLDAAAALALLRHHQVKGDDARLDQLVELYGAHPLTLDHLGTLLGTFLQGDPDRAPEIPSLPAAGDDRQALRLARLLHAYEEHLPAVELGLLCQLCLLRRSVTEEHLRQLVLCSPPVRARTIREIAEQIPRGPKAAEFSKADAPNLAEALDLADSIQECLQEALCSAPIAGPEDTFRQEIFQASENVFEQGGETFQIDVTELARLYAGKTLDIPTDQLPLSAKDREALRGLFARYVHLGESPYLPPLEINPVLETAFKELYGKKAPAKGGGDFLPIDIVKGFKRVEERLRYLTAKHFALQRVRELCRLYQRKWSLAGPLAQLDVSSLKQVLDALQNKHLVLRETGGTFSVHPAVRDHFFRRVAASDQGHWHDVIREQLVTLVKRPGRRLAEDAATLDLVEEAVYHALQSGRADEAAQLYRNVLGGVRHLGWKLGEMARGLRILQEFRPCPEPWDLSWFLRALGELEEAYRHNPLPFFRADIRLLQGRLPRVAAEGDSSRSDIAAFLMGQTKALPPDHLGCAIPRAQILLYLERLYQIRHAGGVGALYQEMGWEGDRARNQLLLAEAANRQADTAFARQCLESAAAWILHSGSVEHLCLLHRVRGRVLRSAGDHSVALRTVEEGLHLARSCGLGLLCIELLAAKAETCLALADASTAETSAREALRLAADKNCQFRWGAAEAGHLLGQALAQQDRRTESQAILKETLDLRLHIGDPGAEQTERLLKQVSGDP